MSNTRVGTIAHLWRFPVKSMQGERLDEATVTDRGILGDRAYALVETDSGKVVSAKSVSAYPNLLACRAEFVEPPRNGELPPARIVLPNGVSVTTDAANVSAVLSKFFGRAVTLAHTAPADFTIDEQHADLATDAVTPAAPAQLGAALFAKLGVTSPVPAGAFFDAFPLSILTLVVARSTERTASTEPLRRTPLPYEPDRCDARLRLRRKRLGQAHAAVGESVRLRITMPDPRCVMTTLAQGELPRDVDVLRTLVAHNKIPVGADTRPCAGVYARVTSAGLVRSAIRSFWSDDRSSAVIPIAIGISLLALASGASVCALAHTGCFDRNCT